MKQTNKLTFEDIFEVLHKQKQREALIKLPENFYSDCEAMLVFLNESFITLTNDEDRQHVKKQIEGIERLFKEIIERRLNSIHNKDIDEWNSVESRLQKLEEKKECKAE